MKKQVFTFMTFFVMCMTLMMISCSDDDKDKDDEKASEEILIGKWVLVHSVYENDTEFEEDDDDVSKENDVIVFENEGVCHNYCKIANVAPGIDPYDWNDYGKWKFMDNSSLRLLFYGEGQQIVKVLKLTSTILSFECTIDYKDGEIGHYTMTYQKVD